MAKKKSTKADVPVTELPEELRQAVEQAKANRVPPEPGLEDHEVQALYRLLSPREVTVGKGADGTPKLGLTSPMLMIFWSSGSGTWSVSVSDKLLKYRVGYASLSLSGSLKALSEAIANHRAEVRTIEKKLTV